MITPYFLNDAWFFVFTFLLSLTGGNFAVHGMMYGPSLVQASDQDTAGTVMAFSLTFGLAIGASVSFAWNPIIGV